MNFSFIEEADQTIPTTSDVKYDKICLDNELRNLIDIRSELKTLTEENIDVQAKSFIENYNGVIKIVEEETLKLNKIQMVYNELNNKLEDYIKLEEYFSTYIVGYEKSLKNLENITKSVNESMLEVKRQKENVKSYNEKLSLYQKVVDANIDKMNIDERYRCKVCHESLVEQILSCGHCFCKQCVTHDNDNTCPVCRAVIKNMNPIYFP